MLPAYRVCEPDVEGVLKGEVKVEGRILYIPEEEEIRSGQERIHISLYLAVGLEEDGV